MTTGTVSTSNVNVNQQNFEKHCGRKFIDHFCTIARFITFLHLERKEKWSFTKYLMRRKGISDSRKNQAVKSGRQFGIEVCDINDPMACNK